MMRSRWVTAFAAVFVAACVPPQPGGPSYLDINATVNPPTDTGRFTVLVNGTSPALSWQSLGNGFSTGATPVPTGTDALTVSGSDASTNIANYTVLWGAPCSQAAGSNSATIVIPINNSITCTLTLTRSAATTPAPSFAPSSTLPTGGIGACPYNVTLSDPDPNATIHVTTDGSQPSGSSPPFVGPIVVSNTLVIQAIAIAPAKGPSVVVGQSFLCGGYTSVDLTIRTGSDDARTDSAIQATLVMNTPSTTGSTRSYCLKYSDNGSFQSCQQSHPGITWSPFSTNSALGLDLQVPFGGFLRLTVQLMEFPGLGKSDDNWDLQSIQMVGHIKSNSQGFPDSATVLSFSGATPAGNGTCFARFKHPHGQQLSSVVFNFSGGNTAVGPVIVMDDDGPHNAPYCKE
jgi:hypothetical protein